MLVLHRNHVGRLGIHRSRNLISDDICRATQWVRVQVTVACRRGWLGMAQQLAN